MIASSSKIVNGVSKKVTKPPPFLQKGDRRPRLQLTLVSIPVADPVLGRTLTAIFTHLIALLQCLLQQHPSPEGTLLAFPGYDPCVCWAGSFQDRLQCVLESIEVPHDWSSVLHATTTR